MSSTVKNFLLAIPISLLLAFLGMAAKVFYDLFLPVLLHPHGGNASSAFLSLRTLRVIEPFVFLIVFLALQWRSGKSRVKLK